MIQSHKILSLIVILSTVSTVLLAQPAPPAKKLTEFAYMIGDWEGSGTTYTQNGVREFRAVESVKFGADSTVILVQGQGFNQENIKDHDAFGVMYLDDTGTIRMHAFSMQGYHTIAEVTKTGAHSFEWGFDLPNNGKINYKVSFTEDTWQESGTYTTPDGNNTYPTLNMTLTRKEN